MELQDTVAGKGGRTMLTPKVITGMQAQDVGLQKLLIGEIVFAHRASVKGGWVDVICDSVGFWLSILGGIWLCDASMCRRILVLPFPASSF